jgi:hypothetical protein
VVTGIVPVLRKGKPLVKWIVLRTETTAFQFGGAHNRRYSLDLLQSGMVQRRCCSGVNSVTRQTNRMQAENLLTRLNGSSGNRARLEFTTLYLHRTKL